jgi:hypothetical protein
LRPGRWGPDEPPEDAVWEALVAAAFAYVFEWNRRGVEWNLRRLLRDEGKGSEW